MLFLEIPLTPDTVDQRFNLTIEDTPYTMRVLWNENHEYFSLSISEVDGFLLLDNIKMVHNKPLVKQYRKLDIAGDFYFIRKDAKDIRPAYEDLGTIFGLYYYDPETVKEYPTVATTLGSTQTVWDNGATIWIDGATITNWV